PPAAAIIPPVFLPPLSPRGRGAGGEGVPCGTRNASKPHTAAAPEASMQPSSHPTRPTPAGDGSPTPRVLLADDHPQGVELLEAYLSGSDYDIQTAADGEETLGKVRDWRPDLILLDIMMPKISGFEVCKRLRADPATHDIAVLMITALDQPSDIDRAVD